MKLLCCTTALVAVLAFGTLSAGADTPAPAMGMDVSSMDCPTIMDHMHTMMMGGGDHMGAMSTDSTASAGMDKTFLMLADEMMHHAQMAAKMELKCGKDPKTMAFAKKMLDDQDYNDAQVKALMTGFP